MDRVIFNLENNLYIIELLKEKRQFGYSKFGNYLCKLRFLDYIGIPQLEVAGTEKQFYDLMNILNEINMAPYNSPDIITYFNSGNTYMFIYVASKLTDFPNDEDDDKVTLQIFEDTIYGRVSRKYIELSYIYLEDFIFNLYQLLEDIDYLSDMGYSSLLEVIGEYDNK